MISAGFLGVCWISIGFFISVGFLDFSWISAGFVESFSISVRFHGSEGRVKIMNYWISWHLVLFENVGFAWFLHAPGGRLLVGGPSI